ncbi:MAG: sigma-70 family RNA polymerase sigma factor [Minicystis sp.]
MGNPTAAEERGAIEAEVAGAFDAGDHDRAVTIILRAYGPEILRFLAALHRDEDDAAEVFSGFAESIWKGAPSFERRCSARTWAYAVARGASLRFRTSTRRREARFKPFPEGSALSEIEARVRTETLSFLRTERRARLTALRDALPPEDQMLLMLRVDRQLAWNNLAVVLADGAAPASEEAQKREAARLRKRFQILKDKLREMGKREGLLGDDRDGR